MGSTLVGDEIFADGNFILYKTHILIHNWLEFIPKLSRFGSDSALG